MTMRSTWRLVKKRAAIALYVVIVIAALSLGWGGLLLLACIGGVSVGLAYIVATIFGQPKY